MAPVLRPLRDADVEACEMLLGLLAAQPAVQSAGLGRALLERSLTYGDERRCRGAIRPPATPVLL